MRTLRHIARATVAASLLVSMAGVASAQSAVPEAAAPTLADTGWNLVATGAGGTQTPVPDGVAATLQIDGFLAGGSSGCNRYFATVTIADPGLTFSNIGSSMMACPEPQMGFEQAYLTALATVTEYSIVDQTLSLADATGAAVLVYEAGAAATLDGPWVATGFNNGNEGVETPPADVVLTADFSPDGTVSGSSGCNTFHGGYSYTADTIAIGPLMGTMMFCEGPAGTIEQQYLVALQNATSWSITNGTLELRKGEALQVSFARP